MTPSPVERRPLGSPDLAVVRAALVLCPGVGDGLDIVPD